MNKEESLDATLGRLEKIRQKVHRKLEANFKILLQDNRLRTISELECEEVIRFMEFLKQAVVCEMTVKNGTKDMQYLLEEFDFEPFLNVDDLEDDDDGPLPVTIDSESAHDSGVDNTNHMAKIPYVITSNPKRSALVWVGIQAPDDKQARMIKKTHDLVRIYNGDGNKISVEFINDLVKTHSEGNFFGPDASLSYITKL